MEPDVIGLVGDVGGTHARFALVGPDGDLRRPQSLPTHAYSSLEAALSAYLEQENGGLWPALAAIAAAGPVKGGAVAFTNLDWTVSERSLVGAGRFRRARVLNDFAASALSIPRLSPDDLAVIGPSLPPSSEATLAVMGPGTGFGVAALVRDGRTQAVLSGEGGHMTFAPTDATQAAVVEVMARRHGRVSVERMLSGPGLLEIYEALSTINGGGASLDAPEAVAHAAASGEALAQTCLEVFCAALGAVAGDFALAYGALGGVFLTGGVAPTLIERLREGPFRERFEDKGRLGSFNRSIATFVVVHPFPNLLGAAAALAALKAD